MANVPLMHSVLAVSVLLLGHFAAGTYGIVCGSTDVNRSHQRGLITSPDYPTHATTPVCHVWTLDANPSNGVYTISFEDYDVPAELGGVCGLNIIDIGRLSHRPFEICGTMKGTPIVYTSQERIVQIRYNYTGTTTQPGRGFKLRYVVGPAKKTSCYSDEFHCGDGKCILDKWRCNGAAECLDGSDETCEDMINRPAPPTGYSCGDPAVSFGCTSAVDQQFRCFPNKNLCDAIAQCTDSMDENSCDPDHKGCSHHLYGKFGSLSSPGYPGDYPPNARCDYVIQVTRGEQVQLRFVEFDLEKGDRLAIYNGPSNEYDILGQEYTYHSLPPAVLTARNSSVYVEFYSNNDDHVGTGFNITYQEKGFCFNGQWRCEFGESECYDRKHHCDGVWHCPKHGGDERGCNHCADHQFSCAGSSHCYDEKDHCNGLHSCPDKSDEQNCQPEQCGHANGTFLCDNKRCIYESWVCDRADDCKDNSDEKTCSSVPSRKVITAAVVGSLLCALLLVMAIGCTCKLHARRMNQLMGGYARYTSPMSRVEDEIWARQSAPPLYDEAMRTSRPFDEAQREYLAALRLAEERHNEQSVSHGDVHNDVTAHGNSPPVLSDDEPLLNLTSPSDNNAGSDNEIENVQLTLTTGAKAQWRRNRNKSRSNSSLLTDEGSSGLNEQHNCDIATDSDTKPDNQTEDLTQVQLQVIHTPKSDTDSGDETIDNPCSGDTVCDNEAVLCDDAGRLPLDLVGHPLDGASVDESDVSLADWSVSNEGDCDVSLLSLD